MAIVHSWVGALVICGLLINCSSQPEPDIKRSTAALCSDDCAPYACNEEDSTCYDWCRNDDYCAPNAICDENQICVSSGSGDPPLDGCGLYAGTPPDDCYSDCRNDTMCVSGAYCDPLSQTCNVDHCAGLQIDDGLPCTVDACNQNTGAVTHTGLGAGAGCFDNSPCGRSGTCTAGAVCVVNDDPVWIPAGQDQPLQQDFSCLGSTGVSTLPSGWKIDAQANPRTLGGFSGAVRQTALAGGAALTPAAGNGIYNFGAGTASSATPTYWLTNSNRAPGWVSDGATLASGGTKSGNLYFALRAPPTIDLDGVLVGYDIVKYRAGSNPNGFRVRLYSSTDGSTWTDAGQVFEKAFPPDQSSNGFDPAPGATLRMPPTRLPVSVPANTTLYLAWNYTVNSQSSIDGSAAQAIGIDNVSLKGMLEGDCAPNCAQKFCGASLDDGCGEWCEPACGNGDVGCSSNAECQPGLTCTGYVLGGTLPTKCEPAGSLPHCLNGVWDGTETDVDCGGSSCSRCGSGKGCSINGDCVVGLLCGPSGDESGMPTVCEPNGQPIHCGNGVLDGDESDVDCGGLCKHCGKGQLCNSHTDCGDMDCGQANGACFGRARVDRVCWPSSCFLGDPQKCGEPDSDCGSNCSCLSSCDSDDPNSACPSGETCKPLGKLFDLPQTGVCLSDLCPSNDPALCGSTDSLCGPVCMCTPNCSAATCANPDDGCGGVCPGVCAPNQGGCGNDLACPAGQVCLPEADGSSACRPSACAFAVLAPPLCGTPGAQCGDQCPACTPSCGGRQCGTDPNCGQSCGTCSAGAFCSAEGQCVTPNVDPPVTVPDANGTQQPVPDPPPPETYPIGAVPGTFSVSDDGAAHYTVPIEVPPGRAGIQPALSLSYAGSKTNGDAGVGWHLEGLSKITRCPRSYALDGYAAPIKNDTSDRFCFDGKRLESVGGAYGATGTQYRTLIDTFAKVVSYNDSGSGFQLEPWAGIIPLPRDAQGPDYFKVWTKDGRILTFGHSRDSLVMSRNGARYAWLLNRVEDRAGNYMLVVYSNIFANVPRSLSATLPNLVRPLMIEYTGHAATPGNRRVEFGYETRSDPQVTFAQGGVSYFGPERLATLTTSINGSPIKNYRFHYPDNPTSQIDSIKECANGSDAKCKAPTTFEYASEHGFTLATQPVSSDVTEGGIFDTDGDGIPDYLLTTAQQNADDGSTALAVAKISADVGVGVGSYFAGGVGGLAINTAWNLLKGPFWGLFGADPTYTIKHQILFGSPRDVAFRYEPNVSGVRCDNIDASGGKHPLFLQDFDQDGRDDIVTACGRFNGDLYLAKSLGNGQFKGTVQGLDSTAALVKTGAGQPAVGQVGGHGSCGSCLPAGAGAPIMLDVDGDALQDVVTCRDEFTLELRRRARPVVPAPPGGTAQTDFLPAVQLFADPAPPPQCPHCGTPPRPPLALCNSAHPTYRPFDIDGDGTPDLLVHGPKGWVVLRFSLLSGTPTLSFQPVDLPNVGGTNGSAGGALSLGDFNGDGLADLASTRESSDSKSVVWLNSGGGVFAPQTLIRPKPALLEDSRYRRRLSAVLDYDADGRADFFENWEYRENPGSQYSYLMDRNFALSPNSRVSELTATYASDAKYRNEYNVLIDSPWVAASDFDGDGITDVLGHSQILYGRGASNMHLTKVVDGLGNFTSISYDDSAYLTDERCAQAGQLQWPERCLPKVHGLVSKHVEGSKLANGNDSTQRTFVYKYVNAHINVTGAGWIGFDRRTIESYGSVTAGRSLSTSTIDYEPVSRYDLSGHAISDATPPYIYPLAGLVRTTTVDQHSTGTGVNELPPLRDADYDPRTQTVNHWVVKLSASGRPFPAIDKQTDTQYERQIAGGLFGDPTPPFENNGSVLSSCEETFRIDEYGCLQESTRQCGRSPVDSTYREDTDTLVTFENRDVANWLINNPSMVNTQSWVTGFAFRQRAYRLDYEQGLLHTVTRGAEDFRRTATFDRDEFGNVRTITESVDDEPDRVTTFEYDADDTFPRSIENAAGLVTQVRFDRRWGKPKLFADPRNAVSLTIYDDFGLKRLTSDLAGVRQFGYSLAPESASSTPVGQIEPRVMVTVESRGTDGVLGGYDTTEYDSQMRPLRSTSRGVRGDVVVQEQVYDTSLGLLAAKTQPHALTNTNHVLKDTYSYDDLRRLARITHSDPNQSFVEYQYASRVSLAASHRSWLNGIDDIEPTQIVRTIDEDGHQSVSVSDYAGRIKRTIDGKNIATMAGSNNFDYGPFSLLSELRDNRGNVTKYSYDHYGRVVSRTDPDIGESSFTYNGFDELKTSTEPGDRVRRFFHNPLGKVVDVIDSQGTTQWIYDSAGRLTDTFSPGNAQNPGGNQVHYDFDPATSYNQGTLPKTVTYTMDGTSYAVGLEYDGLARIARIHYPHNNAGTPIVAQYTYDDASGSGSLIGVDEVGSGATHPVWHVTGIADGHLLLHETYGDGSQSSYGYDPQFRWLESIQTALPTQQIQSIAYTHYDNGQVHTRTTAGAGAREYVYDELKRLSQTLDRATPLATPNVTDYHYDDIGNLTSQGATTNSYLPTKSHLLSAVGNNAYGYDDNGNVKRRIGPNIPGGVQTLEYTPFDLPKHIDTGDGNTAGVPFYSTSFEYSADEDRLIRRDTETALHFVPDLYRRKLDYVDTTLEERFRIYAGDRAVAEIVRSGSGDKAIYFHADQLGSIDTTSDDSGTTQRQQFAPFGAAVDPPSPAVTRAGFTGHDHDDDLGLIDMHGRVYDPLAGRFMSPDAAMQAPFAPQGTNRYSYVFNDPINKTDPSGFVSDWGAVGIVGGFVGAAALCGATDCTGKGAAAVAAAVSGAGNTLINTGLPAIGNVATSLLTGGPLNGAHGPGRTQKMSTSAQGSASRPLEFGSDSPQAYGQNKPPPPKGADLRLALLDELGQYCSKSPETCAAAVEVVSDAPAMLGPAGAFFTVMFYSSDIAVEPPLPPPPLLLYHYTSIARLPEILASEELRPSFGEVHARHGDGVYFTDLSPALVRSGEMNIKQLARRLFGAPWPALQKKVAAYVQVNVTGLPAMSVAPHIFLVPTPIPLPIAGRIVDSGLTAQP